MTTSITSFTQGPAHAHTDFTNLNSNEGIKTLSQFLYREGDPIDVRLFERFEPCFITCTEAEPLLDALKWYERLSRKIPPRVLENVMGVLDTNLLHLTIKDKESLIIFHKTLYFYAITDFEPTQNLFDSTLKALSWMSTQREAFSLDALASILIYFYGYRPVNYAELKELAGLAFLKAVDFCTMKHLNAFVPFFSVFGAHLEIRDKFANLYRSLSPHYFNSSETAINKGSKLLHYLEFFKKGDVPDELSVLLSEQMERALTERWLDKRDDVEESIFLKKELMPSWYPLSAAFAIAFPLTPVDGPKLELLKKHLAKCTLKELKEFLFKMALSLTPTSVLSAIVIPLIVAKTLGKKGTFTLEEAARLIPLMDSFKVVILNGLSYKHEDIKDFEQWYIACLATDESSFDALLMLGLEKTPPRNMKEFSDIWRILETRGSLNLKALLPCFAVLSSKEPHIPQNLDYLEKFVALEDPSSILECYKILSPHFFNDIGISVRKKKMRLSIFLSAFASYKLKDELLGQLITNQLEAVFSGHPAEIDKGIFESCSWLKKELMPSWYPLESAIELAKSPSKPSFKLKEALQKFSFTQLKEFAKQIPANTELFKFFASILIPHLRVKKNTFTLAEATPVLTVFYDVFSESESVDYKDLIRSILVATRFSLEDVKIFSELYIATLMVQDDQIEPLLITFLKRDPTWDLNELRTLVHFLEKKTGYLFSKSVLDKLLEIFVFQCSIPSKLKEADLFKYTGSILSFFYARGVNPEAALKLLYLLLEKSPCIGGAGAEKESTIVSFSPESFVTLGPIMAIWFTTIFKQPTNYSRFMKISLPLSLVNPLLEKVGENPKLVRDIGTYVAMSTPKITNAKEVLAFLTYFSPFNPSEQNFLEYKPKGPKSSVILALCNTWLSSEVSPLEYGVLAETLSLIESQMVIFTPPLYGMLFAQMENLWAILPVADACDGMLDDTLKILSFLRLSRTLHAPSINKLYSFLLKLIGDSDDWKECCLLLNINNEAEFISSWEAMSILLRDKHPEKAPKLVPLPLLIENKEQDDRLISIMEKLVEKPRTRLSQESLLALYTRKINEVFNSAATDFIHYEPRITSAFPLFVMVGIQQLHAQISPVSEYSGAIETGDFITTWALVNNAITQHNAAQSTSRLLSLRDCCNILIVMETFLLSVSDGNELLSIEKSLEIILLRGFISRNAEFLNPTNKPYPFLDESRSEPLSTLSVLFASKFFMKSRIRAQLIRFFPLILDELLKEKDHLGVKDLDSLIACIKQINPSEEEFVSYIANLQLLINGSITLVQEGKNPAKPFLSTMTAWLTYSPRPLQRFFAFQLSGILGKIASDLSFLQTMDNVAILEIDGAFSCLIMIKQIGLVNDDEYSPILASGLESCNRLLRNYLILLSDKKISKSRAGVIPVFLGKNRDLISKEHAEALQKLP